MNQLKDIESAGSPVYDSILCKEKLSDLLNKYEANFIRLCRNQS